MALTPWDFERIESTRTFRKLLEGAIRRHHLLEDLIGYLRLDILVAGGAKFPPPGSPPTQPDPQTPTFERLLGRPPVPLVGPLTVLPPATDADEVEEEPDDKALRARAMLYEAFYKRQRAEDGATTPPDAAPDAGPPEPEP